MPPRVAAVVAKRARLSVLPAAVDPLRAAGVTGPVAEAREVARAAAVPAGGGTVVDRAAPARCSRSYAPIAVLRPRCPSSRNRAVRCCAESASKRPNEAMRVAAVRGPQVAVNPVAVRGPQVAVNPVAVRGSQVAANPVAVRGPQVAVNPVAVRDRPAVVTLVVARAPRAAEWAVVPAPACPSKPLGVASPWAR